MTITDLFLVKTATQHFRLIFPSDFMVIILYNSIIFKNFKLYTYYILLLRCDKSNTKCDYQNTNKTFNQRESDIF